MSELRCRITHLETGAVTEQTLANTESDWPKTVGSDPSCIIRLADARVAPTAALLIPGGRDFVLQPTGESMQRLPDGEFTIHPFKVRLYFPADER